MRPGVPSIYDTTWKGIRVRAAPDLGEDFRLDTGRG
jgi:hypothetical protein